MLRGTRGATLMVGSAVALALALSACGSEEEVRRSWSGAQEPTPLRDDWVASDGTPLSILDVPFGSGSLYCVRTERGDERLEACTVVFHDEEELAPGSGLVTFLNASPLGPDRALFIAVVGAGAVSIELPCGTTESASAPLPGGEAQALFGVASTTSCPRQLDFVFSAAGNEQTVATTATA